MLTATLGSADVAVRNRAILGEGPIWDQRTERLIWVDIIGGSIHFTTRRWERIEPWRSGSRSARWRHAGAAVSSRQRQGDGFMSASRRNSRKRSHPSGDSIG